MRSVAFFLRRENKERVPPGHGKAVQYAFEGSAFQKEKESNKERKN